MRSAVSSGRGDERGTALVAALALVLLIFMITTICLGRIMSSYALVRLRHNQAVALFLAEAGIQKAAARLASDKDYAGETGTRLPTGYFDLKVSRSGDGYVVTATGYADSPLEKKTRRTVRARLVGGRIVDWRENP